MDEYFVNCINKHARMSAHEHITHIGNITSSPKWRMRREDAIAKIEAKTMAFYTIERGSGKKMYVGVVRESGKLPFLRTYADGKWNDNLLAQAECTGDCALV